MAQISPALGNVMKQPFNIRLLDTINSPHFTGRLPVAVLDMFDSNTGDFHPQGLYSTVIFGDPGSRERNERSSWIDYKTYIMHPVYFKILNRLKGLYGDIMMGREYAVWDAKEKDFVKSDIIDGDTGMAFFFEHFDKIKFVENESRQRKGRIKFLNKYRDQWKMYRMYVIPAGMREVEQTEDGHPQEDDINPIYRRLIGAANSVNPNLEEVSPKLLDPARMSMQRAANDIYAHIFGLLNGKTGVIQAKFARRRIFESTRNVLTTMEAGSDRLGGDRGKNIQTTVVGIYQFTKSVGRLMQYELRNRFFKHIYDDAPGEVELIDPKTYEKVTVKLTEKSRDTWGTKEGLGGLLNKFKIESTRHQPVTIDGYYAALLYDDGKHVKVIHGIDELPENRNRKHLRPITWAEALYMHAAPLTERARVFNTRYPVTGEGSIYVNRPYLMSTVKGERRVQLNDAWDPSDYTYIEFPEHGQPFVNSMAVYPTALAGLGGDHD